MFCQKLKNIKDFLNGEASTIIEVDYQIPEKPSKPKAIKIPKERKPKAIKIPKERKSKIKALRKAKRTPKHEELRGKSIVLNGITYRKIYVPFLRYESSKVRVPLPDLIPDAEQEISTLREQNKEDSALYKIAVTMLTILKEHGEIRKKQQILNGMLCNKYKTVPVEKINAIKAEYQVISEQMKSNRIKLKELENERERIIFSDAANGRSI